MTAETDIETVRRVFVEVANEGDFDVVDEIYAEDYVDHNPFPGAPDGREGAKYSIARLRDAFPDLSVSTEDISAHADRVAVHNVWSGTHLGEVIGVPPTGRALAFSGTVVFALRDGLITERWAIGLELNLLRELGLALPWARGRRASATPTVPLVGARPILPDRLARWRELNAELGSGDLAASFAASRKRHRIVRELRWLADDATGRPSEFVLIEAGDPYRAVRALRASEDPFDVWLNGRLAEIHGVDPWQWTDGGSNPGFAWAEES